VEESKSEPDLDPGQDGLNSVQLVLQYGDYKKYDFLLGKRVIAKGTLFGAHTGHHRTSILLTVQSIEELRK
jgi:hypothetical protein